MHTDVRVLSVNFTFDLCFSGQPLSITIQLCYKSRLRWRMEWHSLLNQPQTKMSYLQTCQYQMMVDLLDLVLMKVCFLASLGGDMPPCLISRYCKSYNLMLRIQVLAFQHLSDKGVMLETSALETLHSGH